MSKLFVAIILLFQITAQADSPWQNAQKQPTGYLALNNPKILSKAPNQISCNHLSFRYKELSKIIKEINWLSTVLTKNALEKSKAKSYIQNRLQADPTTLASGPAYQVQISLGEKVLNSEQGVVTAIGILGATGFDLMFAGKNDSKTTSIEEVEGDLVITTIIDTYDICSKNHLDVFILKSCPENKTEEFDCGEVKCSESLTYDWQECRDVQSYRVSLKSLVNNLGRRKKEIKWGSL